MKALVTRSNTSSEFYSTLASQLLQKILTTIANLWQRFEFHALQYLRIKLVTDLSLDLNFNKKPLEPSACINFTNKITPLMCRTILQPFFLHLLSTLNSQLIVSLTGWKCLRLFLYLQAIDTLYLGLSKSVEFWDLSLGYSRILYRFSFYWRVKSGTTTTVLNFEHRTALKTFNWNSCLYDFFQKHEQTTESIHVQLWTPDQLSHLRKTFCNK